jgi:exoribonuclease R
MASELWNNLFNNTFNNLIFKNIKNNYNINLDNVYGIDNRIDYKHLKIYSIDPENCTDADDAFSIYKDDNYIHLIIHIADPTSFFNPKHELFNDIINNGTTIYLSNREPDHMFPDNILEKCSLTNGIKNVISVHSVLIKHSLNTYDIIKSNIEFAIIDCGNDNVNNRYTYEEAAEEKDDDTLLLGIDIANFLYNKRSSSVGFNISSLGLSFVIPKVKNNEVILKEDKKEVKIMKAMIGEFAIHANIIFAQGLDDDNLFLRSLTINKSEEASITLHDLIKDSISATYINDKIKHDLIGHHYTHSTSPLRRASDCIVHFLLKAKYLNIDSPFSNDELKLYADKLNNRTKDMKQLQFKDIKLRTFQWIAEELESRLNPIKITIKYISYKEPFLNLMIIKIDNMDVNIPYTIKKYKYKAIQENINNFINITKINLYNKFDVGTLPELDNWVATSSQNC